MTKNNDASKWEKARKKVDGREIWWFIGPFTLLFFIMMFLEPTKIPYWKSISSLVIMLMLPLGIWISYRAYQRKDEFEKLVYLKGMAVGFITASTLAITFGLVGTLVLANKRGDVAVGWSENITMGVETTIVLFGGFIIFIASMIGFALTTRHFHKQSAG